MMKMFSFSRVVRAGSVDGIFTGIVQLSPLSHNGRGEEARCLRIKRLIEIPQNIINIFEANTQANKVRADTSRKLIFGSQLTVRCRCRMNGKTLRVADVGKVAEELQAFDEPLAFFHAAFDTKAENGARTFRQILFGACIIGMTLEAGIFDPTNLWMLFKIFGNSLCILNVTFYAQTQRLDALNSLPAVERCLAGADVA